MTTDPSSPQAIARRSRTRGWFALLLLLSVLASLACKLIVPRLLAEPGQISYNPLWLVATSMAFGLIAACSVPLAWRWVYRRGH